VTPRRVWVIIFDNIGQFQMLQNMIFFQYGEILEGLGDPWEILDDPWEGLDDPWVGLGDPSNRRITDMTRHDMQDMTFRLSSLLSLWASAPRGPKPSHLIAYGCSFHMYVHTYVCLSVRMYIHMYVCSSVCPYPPSPSDDAPSQPSRHPFY
jgi:hypothetical protein